VGGGAARIAETDRSVRSLTDLADRTAIPARPVQRRFSTYAGVSPSWVLRRYRLLDAAEAVRGAPGDAPAHSSRNSRYAPVARRWLVLLVHGGIALA